MNFDAFGFAFVSNQTTIEEQKIFYQIVMYKDFDQKRIDFANRITFIDLMRFITTEALPSMMTLNNMSIHYSFTLKYPTFILFHNNNSSRTISAFNATLHVANKLKKDEK